MGSVHEPEVLEPRFLEREILKRFSARLRNALGLKQQKILRIGLRDSVSITAHELDKMFIYLLIFIQMK